MLECASSSRDLEFKIISMVLDHIGIAIGWAQNEIRDFFSEFRFVPLRFDENQGKPFFFRKI